MQNTSPIFSIPAASTTTATFIRIKMTSTGGSPAGLSANDTAIGTCISGSNDPGGDYWLAVQDLKYGIHFATTGNSTAIAVGDEIEAFTSGKIIKKASLTAIGVALEASSADNSVIRVKYY